MFFVAARKTKSFQLLENKSRLFLTQAAKKIDIRDDYFYIRNWAVSAYERWGLNGNNDGFLREELKKSYQTFDHKEDDPCWVCLNHVADKEDDSIGEVINPVYDEEEDYVENILAVDRVRSERKRPGLEQDVKANKVTDTSMGCLAEYSICTVCGNIATGAHEYCDHLRPNTMGHRRKGNTVRFGDKLIRVGELYENVNFVEDTIIDDGYGADINAKIFQIAASRIGYDSVDKDALWYAIKHVRAMCGETASIRKIKNIIDKIGS